MSEIRVGEFYAGIKAHSVWDATRNRVRVESLDGEGVPAGLHVECSKSVREQHPLGTVFRLDVRVTSKSGHGLHLCSVRKFELLTESEWVAVRGEAHGPLETAPPKLEEDLASALHVEMLELYDRAGNAVGYWARRYLSAVRRHGGLARAKEMLKPRTDSQRSGLDALLSAGRPELTFESLVLQPRYASLFTQFELAEARRRLVDFSESAASEAKQRERLYPDELTPGELVPDGGRKQVRVNAYERNQAARRKCLTHHGARCMVCGLDFEARYGNIGRGFIHVHHIVPLASVPEGYRLDPLTDLVPVCPNCHAMLHRTAVVLSVAELKERLRLAVP